MSALETQVDGDHYRKYVIQPTEFIIRNQIPFAEANVIKYVVRWRDKGGLSDLRKAQHYLDMIIELETKDQNQVQMLDPKTGSS